MYFRSRELYNSHFYHFYFVVLKKVRNVSPDYIALRSDLYCINHIRLTMFFHFGKHVSYFKFSCHTLQTFKVNGRTQLLFPPTLTVAFRSFEPQIGEPFPNEQLLKKKKIAATERTLFHWETAA